MSKFSRRQRSRARARARARNQPRLLNGQFATRPQQFAERAMIVVAVLVLIFVLAAAMIGS